MKKVSFCLVILTFFVISSCTLKQQIPELNIRNVVDTIGFAQYNWQMDSIIQRLSSPVKSEQSWRVAICPHDDYAYVGDLYPQVLNGIKAKTVLLFGVAHKARNYNLENKIIFDSYDAWSAPYGNVPVSELRDKLISKIPDSLLLVHNEMQSVEHSIEAIIPFLQHNNPDVEIIPILIPYMSYFKMQQISKSFVKALSDVMKENDLAWGRDIAIVISTDAVHYGDEDWGDKNYAPYGTDSSGLAQARNHEMEIIDNCLTDEVTEDKIQKFVDYTVQKTDYKEYRWTWCGRYSVPFGLLVAYQLDKIVGGNGLNGTFIGYTSSVDHPSLNLNDLKMGTTAPANNHHWVGYAAVAYE